MSQATTPASSTATADLALHASQPVAAAPAAQASADERALFEAWLGRPMMNPEHPTHYNGRDVKTAWGAWQAGRAALQQRQAPAQADSEWKQLFWSVAQVLHCLPSSFVDGNGHVIEQAAKFAAIAKSRAQQAEAAPVASAEPTDAQIIEALNSCGIDTRPSKYGFDAMQIDGTSVPSLRDVFQKLYFGAQAAPAPADEARGAEAQVFFNGAWKPASEKAFYCTSEKNRRVVDRATPAPVAAVPVATMICTQCGVDRLNDPCPSMAVECDMIADAHLLAAPVASQPAQSNHLHYATSIALAIWRAHYAQTAPDWKPLDDLAGVLSQIDNMTSRLSRASQPAQSEQTQQSDRDSALRAEPAGQHDACFHGTIDAGEYNRETGMMRVTVKLPLVGLPEELLTINAAVSIAPGGRASQPAGGEEAETDWQRLALAVLVDSRDNIGSDIDGGMVQDMATECGLLVKVEAREPCGESCACVEYGFPSDCYRYSKGALKAIRDEALAATPATQQENDK